MWMEKRSCPACVQVRHTHSVKGIGGPGKDGIHAKEGKEEEEHRTPIQTRKDAGKATKKKNIMCGEERGGRARVRAREGASDSLVYVHISEGRQNLKTRWDGIAALFLRCLSRESRRCARWARGVVALPFLRGLQTPAHTGQSRRDDTDVLFAGPTCTLMCVCVCRPSPRYVGLMSGMVREKAQGALSNEKKNGGLAKHALRRLHERHTTNTSVDAVA